MIGIPSLLKHDPWLAPFAGEIKHRHTKVLEKKEQLLGNRKSLKDFALGYLYFGLHKQPDKWVFREWAPNAEIIYLVGDFSAWKEDALFLLKPLGNGVWEIELPLGELKHGDLYHLSLHWKGGKGDRIPAWTRRVVQDKETLIFNAQVWNLEQPFEWKCKDFKIPAAPLLIYEAHIGMATGEERIGNFREFRENILPRIKKAGYNVLQLMAIQEHPYYGSFGYHVSGFYSPSSRFGTPEDLKGLIDKAHSMGIAVVMDLVHSHAVKNETEGLAKFDGTRYQYFHEGARGEHIAWDSLCFNYGKPGVLHFLLSNCQYWLTEFNFDGFRFDGITSMLYFDHGLAKDFTGYQQYYDGNQDEDAIVYLALANELVHEVKQGAITIAEDVSGMPGLAFPVEGGGTGFDYRLAMGVPDYWIKIIKELPDEEWDVGSLYYELTNRRNEEKTISYAESHDQALVGDKTIIFRLIDKEMYGHMCIGDENIMVSRGMALHKMIRLITLATSGGGYLNFMGNEFGHPEWIDFPREGNNWSYKYARRQWRLAEDINLKYRFLETFDREMLQLVNMGQLLQSKEINLLLQSHPDQVLVFGRDGLLFVFNFNPVKSFTDYGFRVSPGRYRIILNTDAPEFGGYGLVDQSIEYMSFPEGKIYSSHQLKLYIPSRTALVLKKQELKRVY